MREVCSLASRDDYADWSTIRPLASDVDFNGHVNHVAIVRYFEHGRLTGPLSANTLPDGVAFVLVHAELDFNREILIDADLQVGMRLLRLGRTSISLEQIITNMGAISATMRSTFVKLDKATGNPTPLTPADCLHVGGPSQTTPA